MFRTVFRTLVRINYMAGQGQDARSSLPRRKGQRRQDAGLDRVRRDAYGRAKRPNGSESEQDEGNEFATSRKYRVCAE